MKAIFAILLLAPLAALHAADAPATKPNILFIMADELGYYEPAFMGGKNIRTPNLDRMATEGMKFTNMFGGSSVCAPTRCCFLTGKHGGHASVRANGGEVPLAGNDGKDRNNPATYAQFVIHAAAMKFIRESAAKEPFFAYLPDSPPHGNFHIPDTDPAWSLYKDKDWPADARRYAAMVTMLDRQVGEVLALVKELGIEQNTLVCFSGDNGGADYFVTPQHPRGVHSANKHPVTGIEYRGKKGTLYDTSTDPGEANDLAASLPERVTAMQSQFETWAKRVDVVPREEIVKRMNSGASK